MVNQLASLLVRYRAGFALLSLILVVALGVGLGSLRFESDYKIFFSDDNPQLLAHEANQETYTKSDNITFVIAPKDESIFTPETLSSIKKLTDESWKMPFSSRVDSITNYQHTWVEEDDLIVEDFVLKPESTSPFIIINCETPFTSTAYFKAIKSNQPHLRARPVVAPNS